MKILNFLKIVYIIIKYIITTILIALLAIIIVQRVSNNKASIAGIRIFTVITESMVPEYLVGDSILTVSAPISDINIGDDITYIGEVDSFKDRVVTHRVINKEQKEDGTYIITTKGIASNEKDPEIRYDQIYGKVIYKIKIIGLMNKVVGNLYGMYFIIIVPTAILIFIDFVSSRRNNTDEDDEDDQESEKNEDNKKEKRKRNRHKRRAKRVKKE